MAKRFGRFNGVDRDTAIREVIDHLAGYNSGTVHIEADVDRQPGTYRGEVPPGFTITVGSPKLAAKNAATAT